MDNFQIDSRNTRSYLGFKTHLKSHIELEVRKVGYIIYYTRMSVLHVSVGITIKAAEAVYMNRSSQNDEIICM